MSLLHGRIDSTLSGTDGRSMLTPNMSLQTGRIDKRSDHLFFKVAEDSSPSFDVHGILFKVYRLK